MNRSVLSSVVSFAFFWGSAILQLNSLHAQSFFGVRNTVRGGEFYWLTTGSIFVPRGNNYIRLAEQMDVFGGGLIKHHSTFDVSSDGYNALRSENALRDMQAAGYNIVRVFINENDVGNPLGSGLKGSYLDNVTDFLHRAKAHGLYVIPVLCYVPKSGGYYTAIDTSKFGAWNLFYLNSKFVSAKQRYVTDFIQGLKARGAPMDAIFAYAIENEQYYNKSQAPLNLSSGLISTANGGTYDMSNSVSKQQMQDANLVYFVNVVRTAIRSVHPDALVTIGFFTPKALPVWDDRIVRPFWAIQDATLGGSSADFIDLHLYVEHGTVEEQLSSLGSPSPGQKPLVLGEFGALKTSYVSASKAAEALRNFQINACSSSLRFVGFMPWIWDRNPSSATEMTVGDIANFYAVTDEGGAINGVLAPIVRPDPCK